MKKEIDEMTIIEYLDFVQGLIKKDAKVYCAKCGSRCEIFNWGFYCAKCDDFPDDVISPDF